MKPHEIHRKHAPKKMGFYIVTASTSRYHLEQAGKEVLDESGDVAEKIIKRSKHAVLGRELISDDARLLKTSFRRGISMKGVDVVLFTGGTGLSPTDITIETIRPLLEKEVEGFGELFRSQSYRRIGPSAILTRATAGVTEGKLVLCLPGSPDGVKTALNMFIEDIPHLIYVARGYRHHV